MKDAGATRDIYFSVDVEASGPVPGLFNLVSIGAVPVVFREGAWRPEEDRFYLELRPIAPGFDPGAMKIHGIPRAKLEAEGVPADEAMRRLAAFVAKTLAGSGGRAVFVGHNAAFDWSFIAYYFESFGIRNPFGYKALDSKSLAMGRLGLDWFDTGKETLAEMLPSVPALDSRLVHRADYDALFQAYILCALMNHPAPVAATRPRGE